MSGTCVQPGHHCFTVRNKLATVGARRNVSWLGKLLRKLTRGESGVDEFADVHTPWSVRLPKVTERLVGHEDYVRALDTAVSLRGKTAVACVHGPSGGGKTSLVSLWAPVAAARRHWTVLYADLNRTFGEGQIDAALTGFLLELEAPPSTVAALRPAELPRYFHSVTRTKPVLVVLDNAVAAKQVVNLLPAPGSAAVVTSRHPIEGLPAEQIKIDRLVQRDAHELLRLTAGEDRIAAEPAAADLLIERCGGHPLPLRIAGQHLAETPELSVRELAEELKPHVVQEKVVQTEVRADFKLVIDATYRRLPAAVATTFRLLGAQPDRLLHLNAVAALAGLDVPTTGRVLGTLRRYKLVEIDDDERVHLHDLLRAYVADRAKDPADELAEARSRLLRWYIATAAAAGDAVAPGWVGTAVTADTAELVPLLFSDERPTEALAWFDGELGNALTLVQESGPDDLEAWKIPVFYLPHLFLAKRWKACLDLTQTGVTLARQTGDPVAIARCLHSFAWIQYEMGQYDKAIENLEKAIPLHLESKDSRGHAWTSHALGESLTAAGRFDEAYGPFRDALRHFRATKWPFGAAIVLSTMAITLDKQGRVDEAFAAAEEALTISQREKNHNLESRTHQHLGVLHQLHRDRELAIAHFEAALKLRRAMEEHWGVADTLLSLGETFAVDGNAARAIVSFEEALAIFEQLDHPRAMVVRLALAQLDVARG